MLRSTWIAAGLGLLGCLAACGGGDDDGGGGGGGAALPLLEPPMRRAAPAGLQERPGPRPQALDPGDIMGRFFAEGPTSIFRILGEIDDRTTGINDRIDAETHACASATPVEYTVSPWGQTVTLYAQCVDMISDTDFVQWGLMGDTNYLYISVGGSAAAAIATPTVPDGDDYLIQAWFTVGQSGDTWDDGSYGVIQVDGNSETIEFEMAVAGMGMGYCGAQLRSDADVAYAEGSLDMSATCLAIDTLCGESDALATPAECGEALTAFQLPPLGREAAASSGAGGEPPKPETWGASTYPDTGPTVTLDGTDTDDLHFGLAGPTDGVASF